MNGYKGIWFTLGQPSAYGDKYSGGLATYTSSHVPIAVYAKEVKKTFFVYGGTSGEHKRHLLIMISYYDHEKKHVPRPVIVFDKEGVDDPHDNASLALDDKGYIWVFVSGRNTTRPGKLFKSRQPYAIDNFEEIRTATMTYPQPWWVSGKGFFYLFTKYTNGRELYWSTSNDGLQWTPDQKLAGMGGHYQVSSIKQDSIVTVFNYHPSGNVDKRTNLYLLQTADRGQSWTTVDGQPISVPLTDKTSAALVKDYEREGKLVYINDLNFCKHGHPVVLYICSNNFQPGPAKRSWTVAHWNGQRWIFTDLCAATHNYDMGSLYIEGDTWRVIGPTVPGPQLYGTGGEMALWRSNDEGAHWTMKKQLTKKSLVNHSYARRPLQHPKHFMPFGQMETRTNYHPHNSISAIVQAPCSGCPIT
ncbi:MAG TPA: BNR-4 repeat-containing protein [Chitinophagaceae bacterium]|nr:BNR-4 repeat-containing protein [Chitinophagaceae bacterium]